MATKKAPKSIQQRPIQRPRAQEHPGTPRNDQKMPQLKYQSVKNAFHANSVLECVLDKLAFAPQGQEAWIFAVFWKPGQPFREGTFHGHRRPCAQERPRAPKIALERPRKRPEASRSAKVSAQERPAATKKDHKMVQEYSAGSRQKLSRLRILSLLSFC